MTKSAHHQTKSNYQTELFIVKVWREALDDHFEWRGKVMHSGSHQECYFRDLDTLARFIRKILQDENGKDEIPSKNQN